MVLKNPYGYLIKHFKLIHLILTGLYIYLAIKVSSILSYYNHFIEGTASKLDATQYINNYYTVAIFLSFAICIIVYILMRYKKKPRLLYLLLCLLYFVVFIMIGLSYGGLQTIYTSVLETKTLRLYRDLMSILIWFQYVSILIVLFRGLGFDIKKFNFASDLQDLHLEEKDVEEIEVTLGGTQSVERRINRRIREFKYYFLENKAFIALIAVVLLVGGVFSYSYHVEVVDKIFNEGEDFATDRYRFQVLNTYVTNRDSDNNIINEKDYSYVIVRMMIGVNYGSSDFNTSNLILKIGNHTYSPNSKYGSRFADLGIAYRGNTIRSQGTYLFIYGVSDDDIKNQNRKMYLDYAGTKKVLLSPHYLDVIKDEESYRVGERIDFSNSVYGGGHFSISSYELAKQFTYSYEYELMGEKNTASLTISSSNNAILHLVIDSDLPELLSNYSFLHDKGSLKYKIKDGDVVTSVVSDKTPTSYDDGLYLSVDDSIQAAESIWFEIVIRGKKYKYVLK